MQRTLRIREMYRSFFSLSFLIFLSFCASAHTFELRAILNADGSATFYARTYHDISSPTGSFIVDGVSYPFQGVFNQASLPAGTVLISNCPYTYSSNDNYQYVTVPNFNSCVTHTFDCSSGAVEAPLCTLTNSLNLGEATITLQPAFANGVACIGSTGYLSVQASGPSLDYQWQKWDGNVFMNMNDDATYGGTNSTTLSIANVSADMTGDKFRCYVSATDDCNNTSSTSSNEVTLVPGYAPAISAQPQSAGGCAASNVSFSVSATGSNLSYQWKVSTNGGATWSNTGSNAATLNINNVSAGINGYQYRVDISGSCGSISSDVAVLSVYNAPAMTTQPQSQTLCQGAAATFSATATGDGLSYQWQQSTDGGNSWADVQGATATSVSFIPSLSESGYRYRLMVAGTCTTTYSNAATLTVTAWTADFSINSASQCFTLNNFQFANNSNISGGTPTYTWDFGDGYSSQETSPAHSYGAAGTYSVTLTATGDGGCSNSKTIQVTLLPDFSITAVPTSSQLLCNPATTQLTVTPQNGVGHITYTLEKNDGSSQTKLVNSASPAVFTISGGNYTITAVNGNEEACAATATATVTQLSRITASLQAVNATCYGVNNGSLYLGSVSGGTAPYSYSLGGYSYVESTESSHHFENVAPGVYNTYVKDANGCVQPIGTSTILQPAAIVASISQEALVPCSNSQTKITVSATGGKGNYQYKLDDGDLQSTTQFTAAVGSHALTVVDGSGCSTTTAINVTTQSTLNYAPLQIANNTCIGGNSGSVSVWVNGAAASVTYAIEGSNGHQDNKTAAAGTAAMFAGLSAGVYTITANDGAGCAGITSFEVTEPQTAVGTNNGAPDLNLALVAPQQHTMDATTGNTVTLTYDVSSTSLTNVAARGVIVRVTKLFSSWTLNLANQNGVWEKLPENGMPWTEFKLKSGVAINCGSSLLLNVVMQRHGNQTATAAPLTASARFADTNQDLKEGNNFSAIEWSIQ